jgi:transposase
MMKSNMNKIDCPDAVDGPVVSEGGHSPSTLSTGRAAPSAPRAPKPGPLAPGQRWSIGRKREVVLRLMRGESIELLSRELGSVVFKLEHWRQKAETALEGALKEREADAVSDELAAAMQRIGELSMENELLRAKMERPNGPTLLAKSGRHHSGPSYVRPRLRYSKTFRSVSPIPGHDGAPISRSSVRSYEAR